MSTLFNIHLDLVVGPTVWARFEVCHPDQWDVPSTKTIALLVVVEVYDNMRQGIGLYDHRQPFARAEAAKLIANHPQNAKLQQWLDLYRRYDALSFAAEADEAILVVQLTNEDGNPKKEERDPYPKATLVFTVKDSTILTHVASGFSFGSAMCDCRLW